MMRMNTKQVLVIVVIFLFLEVACAPLIYAKTSFVNHIPDLNYEVKEQLNPGPFVDPYSDNNVSLCPVYDYNLGIRNDINRTRSVPKKSSNKISLVETPYKNYNQINYEDFIENNLDIIYVPDDYRTIQSAVENATSGDTIIVRDGQYRESVNIDKSLILMSQHGYQNCSVIQPNKNSNAFTIRSDFVSLYGFYISGVNAKAGISLNYANHSIIAGNKLVDFYMCIQVVNSHHVTLNDNIMGSFWGVEYRGLTIKNSNNFIIENNTIYDHIEYGLLLENSKNNTILNNCFNENNYNIRCEYQSNNNTFLNNSLSLSFYAEFAMYKSSSNKIINNTFRSASVDGILIVQSTDITIQKNNFTNDGIFVYDSFHNTVTNNTVNNKPFIYLEEESNKIINDSAGQIILVNCNNITLCNQDINKTIVGIELFNCTNSTISNSHIHSNNYEAMYAVYSDNNTISNCTLTNCWYAMACYDSDRNKIECNTLRTSHFECLILDNSHHNTISNNQVDKNELGIELHGSNHNTINKNEFFNQSHYNYNGQIELTNSNDNIITGNYFHHHHRGIDLYDSSNDNVVMENTFEIKKNYVGQNYSVVNHNSYGNLIYHNNFLSGNMAEYENNTWDNGYPDGGNYWAYYDQQHEGAFDEYHGPNQNILGGDGLVDTSFQIAGENNGDVYDNYPIIEPYGDLHAYASGPYFGLINNPVEFHGFTHGGTPEYSWNWDFGDSNYSVLQNPNHAYINPGNYTVVVTVMDSENEIVYDYDMTWAKIKESNTPPETPERPEGTINGKSHSSYSYYTYTTDQDAEDWIYFMYDWGDNNFSAWIGPYETGEIVTATHKWTDKGHYKIRVKAWDRYNGESPWSEALDIYLTELTLEIKNRLFFISAQIKNTGGYRLQDINWNLTISGDSIKVFPNEDRGGKISSLLPGTSRRLFTLIIGLSEITVKLIAYDEIITVKGLVFGLFIILY